MSTSPIGTRVPTLSPNSIIRAGIPLSDDFNATDVAVSVQSLLELVPPSGGGVASVTGTAVDNSIPFNPVINSVVSSGTWTPSTLAVNALITNLTFGTSYYSVVGSIANCMISGSATFNFNVFPTTIIGFSLTSSPTGEEPFITSFGVGTTNNPDVSVIINGGSTFNFISNTAINESLDFVINFQYEI